MIRATAHVEPMMGGKWAIIATARTQEGEELKHLMTFSGKPDQSMIDFCRRVAERRLRQQLAPTQ